MAKPSMTEEEIQFRRRAKHRLIGAVVLVTGLVVFLPMVLDNEPKPVADDIAINIPSQDAKPAKVAAAVPPQAPQPVPQAVPGGADAPPERSPPIQPLTVLPNGQAPTPAQTAPAETPKAAPVPATPSAAKPEKPAAAPVELVKSPAPSEHKPPPAAAPDEKAKHAAETGAPPQSGFVVRLGAYAKPENAKQLKAKLTSMGIRNYSDVLKTVNGDRHRVRAGPYATRREAESVRDRLKAVDIDGDIVTKP